MRLNTNALFLPLLALMLSGCATYAWVKPGGDPNTYPADSYACKQESMAAAPPVFHTVHPHIAPGPDIVRTRCRDEGFYEECRTRVYPSGYAGPPQTYDLNERNRDNMFTSCMNARGWILQRIEER